jgi:uncharacterized membrane protein YfcA
VGVGFLGGLFGKGGSAIATPLLAAAGVPAFAAIASPLPATIPSTFIAASHYRRQGLIDDRVLRWSISMGVPATIAGSIVSRYVGGAALVVVTELVLMALGLRLLLGRAAPSEMVPSETAPIETTPSDTTPSDTASTETTPSDAAPSAVAAAPASRQVTAPVAAVITVATATGFAAGLLANSGGFLLAPLFVTVLRMPLKRAFGTSLAAATIFAIPGTITHAALGHIDWALAGVFTIATVPLSSLGAKVALRTRADHLERVYGAFLVLLSAALLVF